MSSILIFSNRLFQSTLPVGEATASVALSMTPPLAFQSTLPVGEATILSLFLTSGSINFNPRFPWGKRQFPRRREPVTAGISIHASRGGSDLPHSEEKQQPDISIHASRGGSDEFRFVSTAVFCYFNPRFPWGKRHNLRAGTPAAKKFQSTLPVGEATYSAYMAQRNVGISIHASRGGSDLRPAASGRVFCISIHASRGGSDHVIPRRCRMEKKFQSTLPVGEATQLGI